MSVYVVTHKDYKKPNIDCYKTLLVGAIKGHILGEDVFNDNTGDNISEKNANYCELTGLYWLWKNANDDYIGLVHYRRFFCKRGLLSVSVLRQKFILNILKKYEVILPKKIKAKPNIYDYYASEHCKEDLDICLDIIDKNYPDFSEAAKAVMQSDRMSLFNMFIMSKELADEYCEWLFGILFKAENKIDLTTKDAYQRRVFGFLSERLFNVWLYKKNLKTYYSPVYNIGDCPLILKFKSLLRKIKKLFKK